MNDVQCAGRFAAQVILIQQFKSAKRKDTLLQQCSTRRAYARHQSKVDSDRIAHRNFADVDRGLLLCSSGAGRMGSGAMLE